MSRALGGMKAEFGSKAGVCRAYKTSTASNYATKSRTSREKLGTTSRVLQSRDSRCSRDAFFVRGRRRKKEKRSGRLALSAAVNQTKVATGGFTGAMFCGLGGR
jgi:hypothetical protein